MIARNSSSATIFSLAQASKAPNEFARASGAFFCASDECALRATQRCKDKARTDVTSQGEFKSAFAFLKKNAPCFCFSLKATVHVRQRRWPF